MMRWNWTTRGGKLTLSRIILSSIALRGTWCGVADVFFFFSAKRVCLICISPCVLLFVFTSTNSDLNWTVFRPYYSAKFYLSILDLSFIILCPFFLFRKTSMSMQDFPFINFWVTEAYVNKMCESSLIFDIDVGK